MELYYFTMMAFHIQQMIVDIRRKRSEGFKEGCIMDIHLFNLQQNWD